MKNLECPTNGSILEQMIGTENEGVVYINGKETRALVDTGSSISTVTEAFLNTLDPKPEIMSIEDFDLEIKGAGGQTLPYHGYVKADVQVSFLADRIITVPLLVVPLTEYNTRVPIIAGTNIISRVVPTSAEEDQVPQNWKLAFLSLCNSQVGTVKATNKVVLQPMEAKTITGFVRKVKDVASAVTETSQEGSSSRLQICPRVVTLNKPGTSARVPVKVFNLSAKVVTVQPKATLCELQEVTVLRSAELSKVSSKRSKVNIQQQNVILPDAKTSSNFDLSNSAISEEQKTIAQRFLSQWQPIFSQGPMDLGHTELVKHSINLDDDRPFKEPYRSIPPALIQEVREHLKEMLEVGAIRESSSPFSSNVVIVRKKDGTIRFCIDYRKLNARTVTDAYAIPRIDDTLHLLAGAKYFSKLDLKCGYWQVELKEDDKAKTAFQVGPLGFYECNRMPFGLCNAPATFQRLMERCMGDINLRDCLIYLDDIIIFSSTFEEHLGHLEAVFKRLQEQNLKLKASKCEFFRNRVLYLGHVVSEEGIHTDPSKTEAVKSWPIPKCTKDVRKFLGFTGYYRRFVKNYAAIARPLNDLLVGHSTNPKNKRKSAQKETPFIWGQNQQISFDTIISKLTNPPVLAYADYTKPFTLHIDASSSGLGAVLYQNQDGKERVVAYASRSLKPSEKHYPAHKLEFLALKWAVCEKYHDYLYGSKFEVLTDNNPLTYVFTTAKLDATGQRWVAALSDYNFTIKYRSGRKNADADGLSRLTEDTAADQERIMFPGVLKAVCQSATLQVEECPLVESLAFSQPADTLEDIPEDLIQAHALTSKDWRKAQRDDPTLKLVIDHLKTGSRISVQQIQNNPTLDRRYFRDWEKLYLSQDVLYRKAQLNDQDFQQLVIPLSYRDLVFKALHDSLGHQGRDRTTSLIKQRFFWPGIDAYVRDRIQNCDRCIKRKSNPGKTAELVNIKSAAPMEILCLDYLSLERSKGGIENILVITDHFSRYAQAIPTRNQTAKTTARVLFDHFVVHYGFPARIHSDQGQNFESNLLKELCKIAEIEKSRTTPYHPMGNGQCERFNQTLLQMLGTLEDYQKSDWKAHVPTLVHAYNATFHHSTGYSPYFLMFGRHPRLAIDAFLGLSPDALSATKQTEYVRKLRERLLFAYRKAQEAARRSADEHKARYDLKVRETLLHPGDRVLVRNVGIRGKQKLADRWERQPYIVRCQPNPDIPVYEVQLENSRSRKTRTLHRNLLLPFMCIPLRKQRQSGSEPDTTEDTIEDETVRLEDDQSLSSGTELPDMAMEDPSETESQSSDIQSRAPPYIIPMRRPPGTPGLSPRSKDSTAVAEPHSRPARSKRKPQWMTSNDWVLTQQHTVPMSPM